MMTASRTPAQGRATRSPIRVVDTVVLLSLVAVVVLTIGSALIGRSVLLSVDLFTRSQPWSSLFGMHIDQSNVCTGDTVDAVLPGLAYSRHEWFSGNLGSWQSYASGGSPLTSVPSLGNLSPISLPYFLLPLWLAPAWVKLLEFAVAVGGMVAFLRRLGASRAAGVLAGVVFALSGFMVVWSNWPQTETAAFIPALFWAAERIVQRGSRRDVAVLGAVFAAMLLSGFPAVTGFATYTAAGYVLVRLVARRSSPREWGTRVGAAAGGLALGVGLSAVQFLPFLSQLSTVDLSYRAQTAGSHNALSTLFTAVVPNAGGYCTGGRSYAATNPIEAIGYVGVAAAVLAVVAVVTGRRGGAPRAVAARGYLAAALVVIVTLGWFGGPLLVAAQQLPVFSNNAIGRIRSVLGFVVGALAGLGYDALRRRLAAPGPDSARSAGTGAADRSAPPAPRAGRHGSLRSRRPARRRRKLVTLAGGSLVCLLVAAVALGAFTSARREAIANQSYVSHFEKVLWFPLLLGVLALACAVLAGTRRRPLQFVALLVLPALVVVQGVSFFRGVLPGDDREHFYPVTPTHRFLTAHLGDDRYAALGNELLSPTSLYYRQRTVTGHEFPMPQWTAMLQAVDPLVMLTPTYSSLSEAGAVATLHSPILDRMAAKYLVMGPGATVGTKSAPPAGPTVLALDPAHPAQCRVSGPTNAVVVRLAAPVPITADPVQVTARVEGTATTPSVTGTRAVPHGLPARSELPVALPATASGDKVIQLSTNGPPVQLTSSAGVLDCGQVTPEAGYNVAFADAGSTIVARPNALKRIRWAGQVRPTTATTAIKQLAAGVPADTVLLEGSVPNAAGRPAEVEVLRDEGDEISARVTAEGDGYLVVADPLQVSGWTASVDDRDEDLRPADYGLVAVHVTAGVHTIRVGYRAPGQRVGAVITVVDIVIVGLLAVSGERRWRRRRARRS